MSPREKVVGLLSVLAMFVVGVAAAFVIWPPTSGGVPDCTSTGTCASPAVAVASPAAPSPAASSVTVATPQPQQTVMVTVTPTPRTSSALPSRTPAPSIDTMTPQQALGLSEREASAALADIRSQDLATTEIPYGVWMAQLSSKCRPFEQVDLEGSQGLGYPDGRSETYPGGIDSARILAFHLALRDRFGPGVILVYPSDLGPASTVAECSGEPLWMTVNVDVTSGSADGVLDWCGAENIPYSECAARPVGISGVTEIEGRW